MRWLQRPAAYRLVQAEARRADALAAAAGIAHAAEQQLAQQQQLVHFLSPLRAPIATHLRLAERASDATELLAALAEAASDALGRRAAPEQLHVAYEVGGKPNANTLNRSPNSNSNPNPNPNRNPNPNPNLTLTATLTRTLRRR